MTGRLARFESPPPDDLYFSKWEMTKDRSVLSFVPRSKLLVMGFWCVYVYIFYILNSYDIWIEWLLLLISHCYSFNVFEECVGNSIVVSLD